MFDSIKKIQACYLPKHKSQTAKYAKEGTGTDSGVIGWINYGERFEMYDHDCERIVNRLRDGMMISLQLTLNIYAPDEILDYLSLESVNVPISQKAPFGNHAYTGFHENCILAFNPLVSIGEPITCQLKISDICVKNDKGEKVPNYYFYIADAGITNEGEENYWFAGSRNSVWHLVEHMQNRNGTYSGPSIHGLGTKIFQVSGSDTKVADTSAYVILTQNPDEVILASVVDGIRSGFAFGIVVGEL